MEIGVLQEQLVLLQNRKGLNREVLDLLVNLVFDVQFKALFVDNLEQSAVLSHCSQEEELLFLELHLVGLRCGQDFDLVQGFLFVQACDLGQDEGSAASKGPVPVYIASTEAARMVYDPVVEVANRGLREFSGLTGLRIVHQAVALAARAHKEHVLYRLQPEPGSYLLDFLVLQHFLLFLAASNLRLAHFWMRCLLH